MALGGFGEETAGGGGGGGSDRGAWGGMVSEGRGGEGTTSAGGGLSSGSEERAVEFIIGGTALPDRSQFPFRYSLIILFMSSLEPV